MNIFESLLLTLFGHESKPTKKMNGADYMQESSKKFADKNAECEFIINNETDPIKREKMKSRLALGITDFSDL